MIDQCHNGHTITQRLTAAGQACRLLLVTIKTVGAALGDQPTRECWLTTIKARPAAPRAYAIPEIFNAQHATRLLI